MNLIYQVALDTIRVTVRTEQGDTVSHHIEVEKEGEVVNTRIVDYPATAMTVADILLQIYHADLQDELLAH